MHPTLLFHSVYSLLIKERALVLNGIKFNETTNSYQKYTDEVEWKKENTLFPTAKLIFLFAAGGIEANWVETNVHETYYIFILEGIIIILYIYCISNTFFFACSSPCIFSVIEVSSSPHFRLYCST